MRRTSLQHTFTISITLFTICVIGAVAWVARLILERQPECALGTTNIEELKANPKQEKRPDGR